MSGNTPFSHSIEATCIILCRPPFMLPEQPCKSIMNSLMKTKPANKNIKMVARNPLCHNT